MKFRTILIACCLSVAAFGGGCGGPQSKLPWTTQDSWYKESRGDGLREAGQSVEVKFNQVTGAMEPKAEALLVQKPVVALSLAQAEAFTGGQYKAVKGAGPYLVRGVYLNRGTGAFGVYRHKTTLFVSHGSLGHHAVPMKRQALVVSLAALPTEVSVMCSMAE